MALTKTTVYKLTNPDMTTFGDYSWTLNRWHRLKDPWGDPPEPKDLCGPRVFHVYETPELAVALNPTHAGFSNPRCFRAVTDRPYATDGTKIGVVSLILKEEIPLPVISVPMLARWGVYCTIRANQVRELGGASPTPLHRWTEKWLRGGAAGSHSEWLPARGRTMSPHTETVWRQAVAWSAVRDHKVVDGAINLTYELQRAIRDETELGVR